MFADSIWSYYEYVRSRILITNPTRIVKGISNALDWPPDPIIYDAFYLIVNDDSTIGREGYSWYSPMVFHNVQWAWINKGTDIVKGVKGANRGDRFNSLQKMKGELLYANAPGYTQKLNWSLSAQGKLVGVTPTDPVSGQPMPEPITWTPPQFTTRTDKKSMNQFGLGAVRIWSMTDVIAS